MGKEIVDPVVGYRLILEADGENLIINTWVKPGGGPPAHIHPNQEERFTVHEGTVQFKVGRRKVISGPGDELVVPAGTKHAFKNLGAAEASFRAELRPALNGEAFFEETAAAAREGLYTKRGLPTSLSALVWAAKLIDRNRELVVICNPPPVLQRLLIPLVLRFSC
jgi:quercetin dioxygenase-like cupin family protein